MVSVAVACDPVPTAGGNEPNRMLTVSSSRSESLVVDIENDLEASPEANVSVVLVGE